MAREWVTWGDAVIGHEVTGKPDAYSDRPPRDLGCWLDGDELLRGAARLAR
ncbi:hypothetical protein [Dactylosporangium sp. CA-233914]|uniref:hypothetical protein n=1 Tax=Dactylosporangium sp. CA-233914 TaxID=3239934 RepID=UPI003D8EEF9C